MVKQGVISPNGLILRPKTLYLLLSINRRIAPKMPMEAAIIEQLIRESLPDAVVSIQDLAGDGDHYAARVVSAEFKGKTKVQQHQMVYAALKGKMGGELHALALTTEVPTE